MCLAVPGRIIRIKEGYADIDYSGVSRKASLRLVESAAVGDYVLVHAGFIIQILDQDAGRDLEELIKEMDFTDET